MEQNLIKFYINELDKNITLNKGEVIAICGRPAIGKTSLALSLIFNNLDLPNNKRCLLIALDNREFDITARLDAYFMNKKPVFDKNYLPCSGIINWLYEERLIIEDDIFYNSKQIIQKIKNLSKSGKIDFVVIDYLQLITDTQKHNSRQDEIAEIVTKLKNTATETNTTIILTSQIIQKNKPFTLENIFIKNKTIENIDKFIILKENNSDAPLSNIDIIPISANIYKNKNTYTTTQIGFDTRNFKFTNL